ncbi:MAG: DUF3857 domain-containing protein [Phycisphaerae bacterium]
MKKVLVAFAVTAIFFSSLGWAEDFDYPKPDYSEGIIDRDQAVKRAADVTAEKYPDADQVVVDRAFHVKYKEDGTHVQWHDEYRKVLTEKGRRANGTLSTYFTIPYQRGLQDCNVPLLEIIRPDGTVVPIDVKANSKLMINPGSMSANIYNPNSKVLRVNVPGLKVGDTLHYVMFDRIVQPRIRNTFCDWLGFESTDPILHATAEIRGPRNKPLKSIAIKDRIKGTLKADKPRTKGGEIIYRWEAQDIPQIFPEPDMPATHMVAQRLLVSTAPDWESISRWYWKISEPHYEPSAELKAKVAELTEGIDNPQVKINTLFRWVSQEIRYMGITAEAEAPGYEPHDVKDTFAQKHGVCRDKAALLVVMLRQAGLEGYPVLIHNGDKKDPEVPMPYFNHAIVGVRMGDGEFQLMDPTDESTRKLLPSYLNNKSFLVATPQGEPLRTSRIVPAEKNMMKIRVSGQVDEKGHLRAEAMLTFDGINDNIYRGYFSRLKPEQRRRYFEGAVKAAAPGAKLTGLNIIPENMLDTSKRLSVLIRFEAEDVLIRGSDKIMLPLPSLGHRVGMVNFILGKTGLEKRQYPLKTGIACGVQESISIQVDPSLGKVIAIPAGSPVDNDYLSWNMNVTHIGGALRGEGDFRLKAVEFSPEQYLVLKGTLKKIEVDRRKMPIFSTATDTENEVVSAPKASADVMVLNSDVLYDVSGDAGTWSETRTVRMRVLTYGGKKQFSEIKIDYNPESEKVELVKAVVYDADGKARQISDKEINVMDAPSARTAPRYPTPKVFVASLPGVEIGSTIEYQYRITRQDQPFFHFREPLQSFDPIVRKTVRLKGDADRFIRQVLNTAAAVKKLEDDNATLGWKIDKSRALQREDMLPPRWTFVPTVAAAAKDWKTYFTQDVYRALSKAAENQTKAAAKARELTEGRQTPDKVRLIRDFVATDIRAAGPDLTEMSLKNITPADKVLADGYGNTSDRAVLLHAMLKAIGLEPRYVLTGGASRVDSIQKTLLSVPDPDMFSKVLVQVNVDDQPVLLNDTSQYAVLGSVKHADRLGWALPDGKPAPIRPADGKQTLEDISYSVEVLEDGSAEITRRRRLYGSLYESMKRTFREMTPELRRRHHQELVAEVSQSATPKGQLETNFSGYPALEEFTVTVDRFAIRDGKYLYFQLPESLENLFWLRSAERDSPLYLSSPERINLAVEVKYPEGYSPVVTPAAVSWEDLGGRVHLDTTRMDKNGKLTVLASVRLDAAKVTPGQYKDLFELDRKLSHGSTRTILLEKTAPAAESGSGDTAKANQAD